MMQQKIKIEELPCGAWKASMPDVKGFMIIALNKRDLKEAISMHKKMNTFQEKG